MLKNIFRKQKEKNICNDNLIMQFRGELEIIAEKDGKIIHRDKQNNIITNWARHANMKLIGSASWSKIGDGDVTVSNGTGTEISPCFSQRSVNPADHTDNINNDGTLISEGQYFENNTDYHDGSSYKHYNTSEMDFENDLYKYPFFPTKMLFGTGVEYPSWEDIPDEFKGSADDFLSYTNLLNGGWNQTEFNENINDINDLYYNYYSGTFDGNHIRMCKTMNDLYSAQQQHNVDSGYTPDRYGIRGAIKNSFFNDKSDINVESDGDGFNFPNNSLKGIGLPCFIYCRRNDTEINFETNDDGDLVTKLSFTVIMPSQESLTGNDNYYPYNGYLLKEAGLFCDARFSNSVNYKSINGGATGEEVPDGGDSLIHHNKMPGGLMWATRPIAPVFKDHRTAITARWTIYIEKQ